MENASKALIIAASVLLGIILLTVFVYVFRSGANLANTYDAEVRTNELALYNSNFEQYIRDNNAISDIISICNLAYNSNVDSKYDNGWAVEILIKYNNNVIFKIPNKDPSINGVKFNRNKILNKSGEVISIYDLNTKSLGELGISGTGITSTDRLTESKIGDRYVVAENEEYGNGHIDKNVTIYKYLFKSQATQVEYNEVTGRVSKMVFTLYVNPDY